MSTKKELRRLQGEYTELRRMLARIFPSAGRKPDALWKQVRRLADHAQWLDFLSDPTPAQPTATSEAANTEHEPSGPVAPGGKSAEQPVLPGVRLADRPRDRNLYHEGRAYQRELERLTKALEKMIDQSADWIRGLDHEPGNIRDQRRPRCDECGEIQAIAWRYCPYCATRRPVDNNSHS